MVINIPKSAEKVELDSDYIIRRKAVDLNIPSFYKCAGNKKIYQSFAAIHNRESADKSWDEYQ